MDKKLPALLIILITSYYSFSQNIGIGTGKPDSSAALDITATNKGLLIPRMNIASINAIPKPARGLLTYDSIANLLMVNLGIPTAPNWQPVAGNNNDGSWGLSGNRGINPATQFIGTTDNQPLRFRVKNNPVGELNPVNGNISWGLHAGEVDSAGFSNIAIGPGALQSNTTSANQVAIGDSALLSNTTGVGNTALGSKTLQSNTSGSLNTAVGANSLATNSTGSFNTATGASALFANTIGQFNTANGEETLTSNISGNNNTAVGFQTLFSNTTASSNTAVGFQSLFFNTIGVSNTAIGANALQENNTGSGNVANGVSALFSNTSGIDNVAIGFEALESNSTGSSNIAIGFQSMVNNTTGLGNLAIGVGSMLANRTGQNNVAIGNGALSASIESFNDVAIGDQALAASNGQNNFSNTAVGTSAGSRFNLGSDNTLIGAFAQAWGDGATNCVALGAQSQCTKDNQVMLGNSSTLSITGFADFSKLSDGRFKKNIKEDVSGIDFIMKLRPITYQVDVTALNQKMGITPGKHRRSVLNTSEAEQVVHSGFIAQEVEKAAKEVGYDFSGVDKPQREGGLYALRYADFVVPLVKAVQEQQQMIDGLQNIHSRLSTAVDELKKSNADQQQDYEDLLKRLEKLESAQRSNN